MIAMKFIAHRERDREHLMQMNVTSHELNSVRKYLDELSKQHPDQLGRIEMARQYVNGWEVQQ